MASAPGMSCGVVVWDKEEFVDDFLRLSLVNVLDDDVASWLKWRREGKLEESSFMASLEETFGDAFEDDG